jgi:hypothetical protein
MVGVRRHHALDGRGRSGRGYGRQGDGPDWLLGVLLGLVVRSLSSPSPVDGRDESGWFSPSSPAPRSRFWSPAWLSDGQDGPRSAERALIVRARAEHAMGVRFGQYRLVLTCRDNRSASSSTGMRWYYSGSNCSNSVRLSLMVLSTMASTSQVRTDVEAIAINHGRCVVTLMVASDD